MAVSQAGSEAADALFQTAAKHGQIADHVVAVGRGKQVAVSRRTPNRTAFRPLGGHEGVDEGGMPTGKASAEVALVKPDRAVLVVVDANTIDLQRAHWIDHVGPARAGDRRDSVIQRAVPASKSRDSQRLRRPLESTQETSAIGRSRVEFRSEGNRQKHRDLFPTVHQLRDHVAEGRYCHLLTFREIQRNTIHEVLITFSFPAFREVKRPKSANDNTVDGWIRTHFLPHHGHEIFGELSCRACETGQRAGPCFCEKDRTPHARRVLMKKFIDSRGQHVSMAVADQKCLRPIPADEKSADPLAQRLFLPPARAPAIRGRRRSG